MPLGHSTKLTRSSDFYLHGHELTCYQDGSNPAGGQTARSDAPLSREDLSGLLEGTVLQLTASGYARHDLAPQPKAYGTGDFRER